MRRPILIKFLLWLYKISNRRRIPPLPRLFTSAYKDIDQDAARIMSRYGIRSPSGIRAAMRKHKVDNVDDLVARLKHHHAQRDLKKRVEWGLKRVSGGVPYNPHSKEIKRLVGRPGGKGNELKNRIRRLKEL